MKPKTKVQARVNQLSRKLRTLTREQKKWADDTLFKHYYYRTLKKNTCLECGHTWAVTSRIPLDKLLEETCPRCKTELEWLPNKKRTNKDRAYFYSASVVEEFQVLRYYRIKRTCKVGLIEARDIIEVAQHWIRNDGKHIVRAVSFNPMGYAMDIMWAGGSDMEIRRNNDNYFLPGKLMPGGKYLKEIRRNGYKGRLHGLHPAFFFRQILCNPQAETLLKAKQYKLLNWLGSYLGETNIRDFWSSIRICLRNNYVVREPATWFDQLRMLADMNKDLLNADYVCPEDLEKEHQGLIRRHERLERKKEIERRKLEIESYNRIFKKKKARYFGIVLTDGSLKVQVIDDVRDYYEEGKEMEHCIFSSRYFEKPDTLCLSARNGNGKRLATVELSLKEWKVLQLRGKNNSIPKEQNRIRNLVESNIDEFKKRVREHKPEEQYC